ncbi:MAG: hypothetical protein AB1640_16435 [bacterium]
MMQRLIAHAPYHRQRLARAGVDAEHLDRKDPEPGRLFPAGATRASGIGIQGETFLDRVRVRRALMIIEPMANAAMGTMLVGVACSAVEELPRYVGERVQGGKASAEPGGLQAPEAWRISSICRSVSR